MDTLKLWEEEVKTLQGKIDGQMSLTRWRFKQGIEKGELPGIDDKNWEEKEGAVQWSMKDGVAYFRSLITLPEAIEEIPVENSNVELTFIFPSGVELFIDGEKVYGHRYWADKIATPFPFIQKAKKGEKHLVVFKTPGGDGLGFFWAKLSIDKIEDILFELNSILYQLRFASKISEEKKNGRLKKYVEDAADALNPEDIQNRQWDRVLNEIRKAEEILEVFRKDAKKFRIHLIGHAHIDMNWLWSYEDTVHTCLRDFETVNKLMERYPDLTFSQSQAHIYKIVEDRNKPLFKKVQEKVKEGRWDVTAATWVEGDINMADGESIVRQILYADRYTSEKFNTTTDVFWSPDTFGHPVTTPTFLNSAGMRYYYFMRCGKGLPLFRWQGRDGKELIAFNSIYNNSIRPSTLLPGLIEYYNRYKIKDLLFVYGVGDHGGGPTEADIKRKRRMEEKPAFPSLEFSTTRKYFKTVEKYRDKLPLITGELNTIFEGCYTTHSDIKKANRECENILFTLETLRALNSIRDEKISDNGMEELWQKALFNQFHDILDGSAIHSSYEYSARLAEEVRDKAEIFIRQGMQRLLSDKKTEDNKITVFNPLGWGRTSIINLPAEKDKGTLFTAEDIPGYGYKTISLKNVKSDSGSGIKHTGDEYENEFYRLRIDEKTGLIRALYDKKNRCEVLYTLHSINEDPTSWWAEKAGNLLSVSWEKPHHMSAWIIGNLYRVDNLLDAEGIETKENRFYTTVSIKRKYMDSDILQRIILYRDFPFIDFENEIDWRQQGNNKDGVPLLRVNFSVSMKNPEAFFEVPFGVVQREPMPKEYPALKWAGFNSGRYWTALFNKNKHGYHTDGNNISLTLLRNPYEPDAVTDSGSHRISYRLFFGKADVLKIMKAAREYSMPPVVVSGEGSPQSMHPFTIKGDVLPSCFKETEGRNSYILRLVEVEGKKQNVEIEFAKTLKEAYLTDAAERRQKRVTGPKNSGLKLNITPYQIFTLELVF